ncbi:LPS-assembly protein LptD [Candidatus Pelagibacter communis]|uniref:LPS-assembly protein LptD n=1 Tax=Candidatus Pelagibacter TaxID=198251 RepID=UPI003EE35AE0
MKNKFFLILFYFFLFSVSALSEVVEFEAKKIELFDNEKKIKATNGMVYSKSSKLKIFFDNAIIDKEKNTIKASGNVKILNDKDNITTNTNELFYNRDNEKIIAKGTTEIILSEKNLTIISKDVLFDNINKLISSKNKSKILNMNNEHEYLVDEFLLETKNNLLKLKQLIFKDNENNIFESSLAFLNTDSNKFFGKDVVLKLDNSLQSNSNEPRVMANSFEYSENKSNLNKGVFTNCQRRDGCPPWEMSAKKVEYNKNDETIYYDDAILRIYDFPVMYFPKFFHPSPNVKRRTGFLMPSIKSSTNNDSFLSLPYFFAIAENRDATLTPRLYNDDKIFIQNEFRQINKNSYHIADFSFFSKLNKDTNNHFFYKLDKNIEFQKFDKSNLNLKIQSVSNDTYIKKNKILSKLIQDNSLLENSLNMDFYSNDLTINVNSTVYENLNKKNNDRFEYILPNISAKKKINNKTRLNGNFEFETKNLIRSYDTNILEKSNINNLYFNSFQKNSNNGFVNNYEFLLKNINSEGKNSTRFKDEENVFLSGIFQYNSSYPLIKDRNTSREILLPKIAFKAAPEHSKKTNSSSRIDMSNIYSLTRLSNDELLEGGSSLTYGVNYTRTNKKKSRDVYGIKFANNLRLNDSKNLPKTNQINQKTSNFFGEFYYDPNEYFNLNYNTSVKNDLSSISYENLKTEFKLDKLLTTFDYLNENDENNTSYLSNKTKYKINDSNFIEFSTRKNKSKDLTEYYNFMYQYKNDCLSASIEYNKDFYSDRDLKPNESILFKLSIIPFGEISGPDILN